MRYNNVIRKLIKRTLLFSFYFLHYFLLEPNRTFWFNFLIFITFRLSKDFSMTDRICGYSCYWLCAGYLCCRRFIFDIINPLSAVKLTKYSWLVVAPSPSGFPFLLSNSVIQYLWWEWKELIIFWSFFYNILYILRHIMPACVVELQGLLLTSEITIFQSHHVWYNHGTWYEH